MHMVTETATPPATNVPVCVACGRAHTRPLLDRYVTCVHCGLVRADPLPREEELEARAEYWSEHHHLREEKLTRQFDPAIQHLAFGRVLEELLPYRRNGRLLDIGCSAGAFLDAAARAGWQPTGVELSKSAAAYAREQRGLDVRAGTLASVDFGTERFDAVVMLDVIEHVFDPARLLREIHEVLAPGGVLLVMTPNARGLGARWLRADWEAYVPDDHLWLFDNKSLGGLAEANGYKRRRHWSIDCNPFALVRALGARLGLGRPERPVTQPAAKATKSRNRLILAMRSSRTLRLARRLGNALLARLDLGDKLYLLVERD